MSEELFDLSGRLAVVTGASRGIGRAMAEALARHGADIVGVSSSITCADSEIEEAVEALGRRFTAMRYDLSSAEAVRELAARLTGGTRPVDILVNNAGVIRRTPAVDHTDDDWHDVLAVDLTAPFLLTRDVGRTMLARGQGKIIFTASLLSFQGGINVPSYAAAKSGLVGLVRALANEWAPHGVNVNAIAPGYISTNNTDDLRVDPGRSAAILERIPARRWGNPDDLAGATVFLASRASDYVNGIVLPIDGGWLAR